MHSVASLVCACCLVIRSLTQTCWRCTKHGAVLCWSHYRIYISACESDSICIVCLTLDEKWLLNAKMCVCAVALCPVLLVTGKVLEQCVPCRLICYYCMTLRGTHIYIYMWYIYLLSIVTTLDCVCTGMHSVYNRIVLLVDTTAVRVATKHTNQNTLLGWLSILFGCFRPNRCWWRWLVPPLGFCVSSVGVQTGMPAMCAVTSDYPSRRSVVLARPACYG